MLCAFCNNINIRIALLLIGSPATTLLGGTSSASGETYDPSYCSVKLPPPQPLAPIDSVTAER